MNKKTTGAFCLIMGSLSLSLELFLFKIIQLLATKITINQVYIQYNILDYIVYIGLAIPIIITIAGIIILLDKDKDWVKYVPPNR